VRDTVEFTIFYQVLTEILTRPTGLVPDAKVEARNGVSILRPKAAIKANADAKKIGLKTKAID